jgi:predicted TIM-barrel fold metal-dependent hydrolase
MDKPAQIATLFLSFLFSCLSGTQAATPVQKMRVIDAHVHFFVKHPAIDEMLVKQNLQIVDITVLDPFSGGYETINLQHHFCADFFRAGQGRVAWVSSFDPRELEHPDFVNKTIQQLEETFQQGAVGVKIYKSIGMELRKKNGEYVMPDDPAFDPILEAIASRGKTLYAHLAEPGAAWKPLDPSDPDYSYYKNNPQWHMAGHPDRPSKASILAARDHMLARHPKLRVVGCHLGSMEEDVEAMGKILERYPNLAVDTGGRVVHLTRQDRQKVRKVLIKYQDRILYATDDLILPGNDVESALQRWAADLERDWKFFATSETVEYAGRKVQGLALPDKVLRKLFRENALKWVPGIVSKNQDPSSPR